ncbi:hypothetical protein C8Q74DRAFT_1271530 [Fomes fomentarius]|nr:hypothetical protein C8Q74DRAFT_1271530 [Fomes fomentarius]
MSARTLFKACPYRESQGCTYVSQTSSSETNQHNVGSHVSNLHGQMTKVWYGSTQVTIHRDNKTKLLTCPCGSFTHKNASLVRRHAANSHKGSATMAPRSSSPAVVASSEPEECETTPPQAKAPTSSKTAISRRASVLRVVEAMKKDGRVHIGGAIGDHDKANVARAAAASASSAHSTAILPRHSPAKRAADEPTAAPSSNARRVDQESASHSKPPSNSIPETRPKPFKRVSDFASAFTISKSPTSSSISARVRVPSKRGLSEISISGEPSKVRRLDNSRSISDSRGQLAKQSTVAAKPSHAEADSAHGSSSAHTASTIPTRHTLPVTDTNHTPAMDSNGPIKPSTAPAAKPSPLRTLHRSAFKQPKNKRLASKFISYSTSKMPTSSSSSSLPSSSSPSSSCSPNALLAISSHSHVRTPSANAAPAKPSKIKEPLLLENPTTAPAPKPAQGRCASCGTTLSSASNWDKCTICRLKIPAHHEGSTKSEKCATAPAGAATANDATKIVAGAPCEQVPKKPQPKPRPRVTKHMREREFQQWFSEWTKVYRARKASGLSMSEHGNEDKADYWRVNEMRREHGTTYPTPEAFFEALRECTSQHRARLREGQNEVVHFYGAYSIVAQPRIAAFPRHEKVRERMREIGIEMNNANCGMCRFTYQTPGRSIITVDDVYKYPCACGGSIVPNLQYTRSKVRVPDEKYAGPCGGTIMVVVGNDDGLKAYGTKGQWVAVDIVH